MKRSEASETKNFIVVWSLVTIIFIITAAFFVLLDSEISQYENRVLEKSNNGSKIDEVIIIDRKPYIPLDSNRKIKTIEIDGIIYQISEKEIDKN